MISVTFTVWMATLVPHVDQYYCKLQWIERDLCTYWCANTKRGFNWFEPKTDKGCKLEKKFYKASKGDEVA